MNIIALETTNVKRLRVVNITPQGNVVQITGKNGSGKSSVLDSICFALGGKKAMPSRPVRAGCDVATIRLDMGEVIVTRSISADGRTEVRVEAANGARFPSPQRMLDDLLGELTFDPLKFTLAEPRTQLETLRSLVKLDVDLDALDGWIERDYADRTAWNSRAKSFAQRVSNVEEGIDWTMDVTPIDISALADTMARASEHNTGIATAKAAQADRVRRHAQLNADAQRIEGEIAALNRKLASVQQAVANVVAEMGAAPSIQDPIDVTEIREQIAAAEKENARRNIQERQREQLAHSKTELADAKARADELTANMEVWKRQKSDAIAAAKMPVDGLSFGAGEVLYNGIPLAQASSAEQLKVSFAIAMATNPKLKVVLIKDGSLLDDDSMAALAAMAEEQGYQIWLEKVDTSGRVGIVMEDGEVVSVDGVPVEKAAEPEVAGV